MTNTELKRIYRTAAKAKAASEAAIMNDAITEAECDAIVDAECDALDRLVDALMVFTMGQLTERDARNLAYSRFERVGELIARLAA